MNHNHTSWAFFALINLFLILSVEGLANNIQVSNVSLTGQNLAAQTVLVQFDLSWENSWRLSNGPANWDAAWVFIKHRTDSLWNHGTINYVNGTAAADGHTEPAGGTITTPADSVGVFIYRDANGNGHINFTGIQLQWNYGADGVMNSDLVDLQVFAIEMVYVPQSSFSLGDGGGASTNRFYPWPSDHLAYTVASESAINVGPFLTNLYYENQSSPVTHGGDQAGPIPLGFPKGYRAFYCMKYECSQGQWVDFFNCLTPTQKANHDVTDSDHKDSQDEEERNTISYKTQPILAYDHSAATTTTPDRAVNYLKNEDVKAYLDWAGLRLMTELEYEKACRGRGAPVANEFAWGNPFIYISNGAVEIVNDGKPNSYISNPGALIGNAVYFFTSGQSIDTEGPLRCGIMAASAINKTREETGATYYGIMEMSGNLFERTVTVGTVPARAYTGRHGDGQLTTDGWSNVFNWPPPTGGSIGLRGGNYNSSPEFLQTSNRWFAAYSNSNDATPTFGFRGVRTSP